MGNPQLAGSRIALVHVHVRSVEHLLCVPDLYLLRVTLVGGFSSLSSQSYL